MKCLRSRLVVHILILLAITLATVVRCQDEQQATTEVTDGGAAVGADDVEIRDKDKEVRLVKSECVPNKLLGGLHEVDLTEPEHQQRIQAGLKGYAKGKNRASRFIIRCGTVQIVAGTIHRYTVDLVDKDDQVTNTCSVKIYTPLRDTPEYTFNCQDVSRRVARDVERKKLSKGPKTGVPLELTPEEFGKSEHTERIQSMSRADESTVARVRRHAKKTGASNELSAEDLKDRSHIERIKAGLVAYNTEKSKSYDDFEIVKGSVQLVAGSLYKYTFKVKGEPEVVCKISVWERIWMDTQEQRKYNVKCDGDDEPE